MPIQPVSNGDLFYEVDGEGYPLVMVHGAWNDRFGWMSVVPGLAQAFRVVTYDRRGHGNSSKPGDGTRRDDEDDLATLIEGLDIAPCHIAASSYGSSLALSLAGRRPDLVRTLVAHEPPLYDIVDDPNDRQMIDESQAKVTQVLDELRAGNIDSGARRFVEEVALGPGAWDQLPAPVQKTFKANAMTFVNEQADPDWCNLDLDALARFSGPVLLSGGDQSPPFFAVILDKLQRSLKKPHRVTYQGAGHVPQMTHPDLYVERVTAFIKSSA